MNNRKSLVTALRTGLIFAFFATIATMMALGKTSRPVDFFDWAALAGLAFFALIVMPRRFSRLWKAAGAVFQSKSGAVTMEVPALEETEIRQAMGEEKWAAHLSTGSRSAFFKVPMADLTREGLLVAIGLIGANQASQIDHAKRVAYVRGVLEGKRAAGKNDPENCGEIPLKKEK